MSDCCGKCKFSMESYRHHSGVTLCRRYPPTRDPVLRMPDSGMSNFQAQGHWPEVSPASWCGEFAVKPDNAND